MMTKMASSIWLVDHPGKVTVRFLVDKKHRVNRDDDVPSTIFFSNPNLRRKSMASVSSDDEDASLVAFVHRGLVSLPHRVKGLLRYTRFCTEAVVVI